jgi:hypothetical protein
VRYLSKRLRDRLPDISLIVGLWDSQGDLSKASARIACDAVVVATLSSAREKVDALSTGRTATPDTRMLQESNSFVTASV